MGSLDLASVVFGVSWFGVFADSEQKIEGNLGEVGNCFLPRALAICGISFFMKVVGYCDW